MASKQFGNATQMHQQLPALRATIEYLSNIDRESSQSWPVPTLSILTPDQVFTNLFTLAGQCKPGLKVSRNFKQVGHLERPCQHERVHLNNMMNPLWWTFHFKARASGSAFRLEKLLDPCFVIRIRIHEVTIFWEPPIGMICCFLTQ